jgi:hypothetical protein
MFRQYASEKGVTLGKRLKPLPPSHVLFSELNYYLFFRCVLCIIFESVLFTRRAAARKH